MPARLFGPASMIWLRSLVDWWRMALLLVENHGFNIKPWKIMFLLNGIVTIIAGLIFFALVPDNQLSAWWLSKKDRV